MTDSADLVPPTGRVHCLHRAATEPEADERWLARPAEQDIVAEYHPGV